MGNENIGFSIINIMGKFVCGYLFEENGYFCVENFIFDVIIFKWNEVDKN